MSICVPHPNFGCLIRHCALFHQNASGVYASGPGLWEVSPASSGTLRIVTTWQHLLLLNIIFKQWTLSPKIKHKLSYKHPHPLFKSTSAVHNIWSCVKSTQFLTQEFQNSPHFFQSRTNFPNSKKKAFCYAFNVRSIISMKIMTKCTESRVRRGHGDASHFS